MKRTTTKEALEIGERIRVHRTAVGLTGDDIHDLTGIHPAGLSQMEHGYREPTLPQRARSRRSSTHRSTSCAPSAGDERS